MSENPNRIPPIRIDDAQIRFRNFSGKPDNFNKAGGKRTFCVLVDPEVAVAMAQQGWNIKTLRAREEGDIDQPYLQIEASYKIRPPEVFIVTPRGKTRIGESEIEMLDWAEITKVDLSVNAYPYDVNGRAGIKAYLGTMYAWIVEDPLAEKYADIPTIGSVFPSN